MKSIVTVLIAPLSRRLGSMAAGGVAGIMVTDPAIAHRLEAWVAAGVLLAADLIIVAFRGKPMEGR